MKRDLIEDVLDVLHEIRKIHVGRGAKLTAPDLRKEAVSTVSARELKGRFQNDASAIHSIQDACSRRLHLKIADFDEAVNRLLSGDHGPLKVILDPVKKNTEQHADVAAFFVELPQPTFKPEFVSQQQPPQQSVDINDAVEPERRETVINRIIRDTAMARSLKQRYQNHCQMCNLAVELGPSQTYSEGHHIRPLGQPHNGPDTEDNILVLCPNHHVQCDYRAIKITLASLHLIPGHNINQQHLDYHNLNCSEF